MDAKQLLDRPVPVWILGISEEHRHPLHAPFHETQLADLDEHLPLCAFRGVSVERLTTVLRTGIDVEPPDATVYVNCFEKAWEYGGFPKLVLALDRRSLGRTFRDMPSASSPDERRAVQNTFPTVIESVDGDTFWFSRLAADDPGIATPYEVEHARWIPGDPFEALRGVLVFASEGDADAVSGALSEAMIDAMRTSQLDTSAD